MKIPFFNYPAVYKQRKEELDEVISDVLSRGAFIMQEDLYNFEKNLSQFLGVKHAIGMADGTMALLGSLISAGIGKGDEVLVPSHTFVASAAAIHHTGAKPVLVDCLSDHLISPESVQNSITSKTKGIMPVQLNGRVAKMDQILQIADKHNLIIVEDSCQALGARYKNKYAGTFGAAGTFSFFPAKTLGCFGDGGAVITNDDSVAEKLKMFRDHGRDPKDGKAKLFGYNARLDNLQAAVLNLKLQYYDEDIKTRRRIASIYNDRLQSIEELLLPPGPNENSIHFDVFQNYEIEANEREKLRNYLNEKGVGTILQWGGYALHEFDELNLYRKLEYTEKMTSKFLLLPMHHLLSEDEANYISDQIVNFYS